MNKRRFCFIYFLFLVSFSVYVLLDTFVIKREYKIIETEHYLEEKNDVSKSDLNSYTDQNISINIYQYREYSSTIYVADIILSKSQYLKTAFANSCYGKNIVSKTSDIAKSKNAIVAINGDFYGVRENGYVLRNGVIYRNIPVKNQEDLAIYKDGRFEIINEYNSDLNQLLHNGVYNVLSFGPGLIDNNEIIVDENDEVKIAQITNPRTAIGIIDDLHYVFVVADARTKESRGLTLYELAQFMKKLSVVTAYNLDGGGSSTLYFNGEIINVPMSNGRKNKEREVSDIIYVGY